MCCGFGRYLCSIDCQRDIFNSNNFFGFRDVLDSRMKELRATGNFEVKKHSQLVLKLKICCAG
jgi:hypothetical protein